MTVHRSHLLLRMNNPCLFMDVAVNAYYSALESKFCTEESNSILRVNAVVLCNRIGKIPTHGIRTFLWSLEILSTLPYMASRLDL